MGSDDENLDEDIESQGEEFTLMDVVNELAGVVEDSNNFMTSEFSTSWEGAERYFAGEVDLPTEAGRSKVVKTVVRDIIRAAMPNIMRTLLHSRKPVEYWPNNIQNSMVVAQQGEWINQEFARNRGYWQLYQAVMESLKNKSGPIKTYWEENPQPSHFMVKGITAAEVQMYLEDTSIEVTSVEEVENESPTEGSEETLFNIEAVRYYKGGRLVFEAFPIFEFFVDRNATDLRTATHGHRRQVTLREAMEMGLEDLNIDELSDQNPETENANGASVARRGYNVDQNSKQEVDPLNRTFLLSETYCMYDLDGDGIAEKYCFYLGGTGYKYLHHEKVEDFSIDLVNIDPIPFSVIGHSMYDILKEPQDVQTSLLRTMIDNAHIANNPRAAGDPTKVDFTDLMNNAIGAPIKTKGRSELQIFEIPFTAAGLLPVLDYFDRDAEMKSGVTKNSMGLDPDALQSTDKQAVMNSIQLSQGQIELMVRNIVETALIPIFQKALRLCLRHYKPIQMMKFKGAVIPVDISKFDPELMAQPNVGLGTGNVQQKLMTLQFIYGEQQKYMSQFGLDNPFTSLSQMYNTLEDMIELGGIPNVGRYFNYVGVKEEQVIAKALAEQAAKAAQQAQVDKPVDPARALVITEAEKTRAAVIKVLAEQRKDDLDRQLKAMQHAEEIDFKRDELRQKRVIELAANNMERLNATIQREQNSTAPKPANPAGSEAANGQRVAGNGLDRNQ